MKTAFTLKFVFVVRLISTKICMCHGNKKYISHESQWYVNNSKKSGNGNKKIRHKHKKIKIKKEREREKRESKII